MRKDPQPPTNPNKDQQQGETAMCETDLDCLCKAFDKRIHALEEHTQFLTNLGYEQAAASNAHTALYLRGFAAELIGPAWYTRNNGHR